MSTNNINFYGSSSSKGFENWIESRIHQENEKLLIKIEILSNLIEQLNERLNNQEKLIKEMIETPEDHMLYYERVYGKNPMKTFPYVMDAETPSSNPDNIVS